jgi:protein-disulfide isomerase
MSSSPVNARIGVAAIVLALGSGVAVGRQLTRASALPPQPVAPAAVSSAPAIRYMVPVSSSQPSLGPADALVTIVQWCDLPDPGCAALEPARKALLAQHPDTIRWVSRHYPRTPRPESLRAHAFARVAHVQAGKFWEARALLLELHAPPDDSQLERYALQLGLDWQAVRGALDGHNEAGTIAADRLFADMFEVHDAPALFVNGRSLGDRPDAQTLQRVVDEELAGAGTLVAGGVAKRDVYAQLTKHGTWKAPPKTATR